MARSGTSSRPGPVAAAAASWVYLSLEPGLWTVGFYDPSGGWHPESDHADPEAAAARCHYLNGGGA